MALNGGLRVFRRSLLSDPHKLRLYPIVRPRVQHTTAPPFRVASLSTKPPLNPHRLANPTLILTFTRGLRSALERSPIRRIVRPPQSPFSGGGGNDFLERWKRRIDRANPDYIFYAILGVNGLVFLMWGWAQENLQKFRDPEPLRFMFKHFTTSWTNVLEGRIWTLLTACFSHEMTGHLLVNGMSFWFMAPPVMRMLGNSAFLALYLGGGIASSTFSLVWNAVVQHRGGNAHGASGAIYSVISLFACLFPNTTFLLFFIVPVPAWLCVSGIFAWDLYGSLRRRGGMTDSAGHVGGVLAGVAYFLRMRRGFGLKR
ncbi:S54 family peptidase [Rhizoctonia solani 123E]|uniref:S54 family peptidase n=1 Tax=Rhizoctonia solani 123E TaxID=1423351 RepID=A0A074S2W4_9AGAM|nr:S54 family peptidase [Rhizoctonia solani 123E]